MKENYLSKNVPLNSGKKMPVIKVDEKWRIHLTKDLRKAMGLAKRQSMIAKLVGNKIILEKIHSPQTENDPFLWDIEHPAKIKNKKIKKLLKKLGSRKFLEMLEEEQWSGA